jgi:hypothetical protein
MLTQVLLASLVIFSVSNSADTAQIIQEFSPILSTEQAAAAISCKPAMVFCASSRR